MGAAHRQGEGSISPALQGLERGGAGAGAPLPHQEAMCRLNSTNVLAQVLGQGRTGSPSWQPEAPPTAFPAGAGTWGRRANTRGPLAPCSALCGMVPLSVCYKAQYLARPVRPSG